MIYGTGVIVRQKDGKILIGRRKDDEGWCGGGGHIEAGETPRMAARRELVEEFNIHPIGLEPLGVIEGIGYISYIFLSENFYGEPHGHNDEIGMTMWVHPDQLYQYRLFEPFEKSLTLLPPMPNTFSYHRTLDPADAPSGVIQLDKSIELTVNDPDKNIESLIEYIRGLARRGTSFQVLVDPKNEYEKAFYIDGDGPDRITRMEVQDSGEQEPKLQDANSVG